ncbi:hypothetical protein DFH11DRAFT_1809590 [Phellopilus nigrolimitatus]|nr:hypothetical protein DFH11DRAFT_1809590 [Phellopilus nigrolimitatus]
MHPFDPGRPMTHDSGNATTTPILRAGRADTYASEAPPPGAHSLDHRSYIHHTCTGILPSSITRVTFIRVPRAAKNPKAPKAPAVVLVPRGLEQPPTRQVRPPFSSRLPESDIKGMTSQTPPSARARPAWRASPEDLARQAVSTRPTARAPAPAPRGAAQAQSQIQISRAPAREPRAGSPADGVPVRSGVAVFSRASDNQMAKRQNGKRNNIPRRRAGHGSAPSIPPPPDASCYGGRALTLRTPSGQLSWWARSYFFACTYSITHWYSSEGGIPGVQTDDWMGSERSTRELEIRIATTRASPGARAVFAPPLLGGPIALTMMMMMMMDSTRRGPLVPRRCAHPQRMSVRVCGCAAARHPSHEARAYPIIGSLARCSKSRTPAVRNSPPFSWRKGNKEPSFECISGPNGRMCGFCRRGCARAALPPGAY